MVWSFDLTTGIVGNKDQRDVTLCHEKDFVNNHLTHFNTTQKLGLFQLSHPNDALTFTILSTSEKNWIPADTIEAMDIVQPVFVEAVRVLQSETINSAGDYGETHSEVIHIMDKSLERDFDVWDSFLTPFNASAHQNELQRATDIEISAFITSLCVNFVIFLVVLALYEVLSRWLPSVYQCRSSEGQDSVSLPKSSLPLNWVPIIMRVTWIQLRKHCGMDNYFFLRYIRMVLQITAVSGLWGLLILWYVHTLISIISFPTYYLFSRRQF